MTIEEYDDYFEAMASKMKSIQHGPENKRYSHYHIEEVIVGLRENLDFTGYCFLQEDITGQIQAKTDENVNELQTGAIMILQHVAHDDFRQERIVLDKSLKLAKQVAARMISDKRQAINGTAPRFLRGLNVSGFYYEKAQNLFDHCFGWRLEFQFQNPESLLIDEDEWID